jgi:predicted nucleotidyltransferase
MVKVSKEDWIKAIRPILEPFQSHFSCACLVGSVARGTHHEGSDLDIVLIAKKPYNARNFMKIKNSLQQKLNKQVDLIVYTLSTLTQDDDDIYLSNNVTDAVEILGKDKNSLRLCTLLWTSLHK